MNHFGLILLIWNQRIVDLLEYIENAQHQICNSNNSKERKKTEIAIKKKNFRFHDNASWGLATNFHKKKSWPAGTQKQLWFSCAPPFSDLRQL